MKRYSSRLEVHAKIVIKGFISFLVIEKHPPVGYDLETCNLIYYVFKWLIYTDNVSLFHGTNGSIMSFISFWEIVGLNISL